MKHSINIAIVDNVRVLVKEGNLLFGNPVTGASFWVDTGFQDWPRYQRFLNCHGY